MGRPKGSKNKPKIELVSGSVDLLTPRKRGRPAKVVEPVQATMSSPRKRGRPAKASVQRTKASAHSNELIDIINRLVGAVEKFSELSQQVNWAVNQLNVVIGSHNSLVNLVKTVDSRINTLEARVNTNELAAKGVVALPHVDGGSNEKAEERAGKETKEVGQEANGENGYADFI